MEYKDTLMDQVREFARFLAHLTHLSDQDKSSEVLEEASQYLHNRYGLSSAPNADEINLMLANKSLPEKELDQLIQLFELLQQTNLHKKNWYEPLNALLTYKSVHSHTYDLNLHLKIKALYDLR